MLIYHLTNCFLCYFRKTNTCQPWEKPVMHQVEDLLKTLGDLLLLLLLLDLLKFQTMFQNVSFSL